MPHSRGETEREMVAVDEARGELEIKMCYFFRDTWGTEKMNFTHNLIKIL